jgi:hypothetical protein
MKSIALYPVLLTVCATVIINAAEKPEAKPASPATTTTNAPGVQVIAYYFHGTVRCETCQKIEKQAREVFERQFKSDLAAQRLVFKPVNYDLPENAHFLHDFKLPCPSLVIVRRKDGKDDKWRLLGDTWKLVEDAKKFDRYVEEETQQLFGLRQ